jgi:hypothetical protein
MQVAKIIGIVSVAISVAIIIICLFKKNEPFFNLRKIFFDHLNIFQDCKSQYIIFYVLPVLFAVGLSLVYSAGLEFYSQISIILSILLSMLLASLSILCGYDFSTVEDAGQRERAQTVIKDTTNAIIFDCVLCLFMLLIGLTVVVLGGNTLSWLPFNISVIKVVVSGISYYIFLVIILNLLLIVKQLCKIIEFYTIVKKR